MQEYLLDIFKSKCPNWSSSEQHLMNKFLTLQANSHSMKSSSIIISILLSFLLIGCKTTQQHPIVETTKADKILAQTIEAHGGKRYDSAHYQFMFRHKIYQFKNSADGYRYTLTQIKDGATIVDVLTNNQLSRTIDGKSITLSNKQASGYGESVNSVIYFATLPHKLQDPAVNSSYKGEIKIKNQNYDILEITFNKIGGGKDHDDVFHYWINQETQLIDYLAYNYQVNGGGVRFRSAYNSRNIGGIVFQDYENYKAPVGTPLAELPVLFEQGALKKLSLIETEDVKVLK